MFFRKESNLYVTEGMPFTIDDVQFPSNFLNLSSPEEKTALGLVEVVATNSPANPEYYWVSENLKGAKLTYVNTPKDLATVQESAVNKVKQMTFSILQPTDYVEARNLRNPDYKLDWMLWRDSIRKTSSDTVTAINGASSVDAVEAIMQSIVWANDPSYVAPVVESAPVLG